MVLLYLKLYYEFAKIGLFAVGGGLATIPFLVQLSDKTGWFSKTDLVNMIAISESTPGAIGVNMATYVGYLTGGGIGGIISTLGLITPSIIVILIVSHMLKKFKDNPFVNAAFYGLRAASTGLIVAATYGVFKISFFNLKKNDLSIFEIINFKGVILGILLYLAMKKIKIHPIGFIILSGVIGVIFKF